MTETWWPDAIPDPAPVGTGLAFSGGPPKGLLHTTEGSTYAGARAAFATHNSWPHFTLTYETGRFVARQHLPIDVAARSLRNLAGGVQTNTDHVIQAEMVGYATAMAHVAPGYLDGIARWMRWVESAAGVRRRSPLVWKPYPDSYGADNGVRMSPADWDAYDGWCGHQHAPENLHGDPGAIDIDYLLGEEDSDMTGPEHDTLYAAAADAVAAKRYVVEVVIPKLEALDAKVGPGGIDLDALAERVADKLAARLAS
ncbi:MAG TPA: hypothetical protein VFJ85_02805 [Acidimicrobiales bacterium]|nr:hypothetical protein [Acidimicrobiales bacterium]